MGVGPCALPADRRRDAAEVLRRSVADLRVRGTRRWSGDSRARRMGAVRRPAPVVRSASPHRDGSLPAGRLRYSVPSDPASATSRPKHQRPRSLSGPAEKVCVEATASSWRGTLAVRSRPTGSSPPPSTSRSSPDTVTDTDTGTDPPLSPTPTPNLDRTHRDRPCVHRARRRADGCARPYPTPLGCAPLGTRRGQFLPATGDAGPSPRAVASARPVGYRWPPRRPVGVPNRRRDDR